MKKIVCMLVFLLCQTSQAAVSVGGSNDLDCHYHDLQSAINDGHDDIRLSAQSTISGAFTISGSTGIQGGFLDCAAANANNNDGTSKTTIQANNSDFTILNINQAQNVTLKQLQLQQTVNAPAIIATGVSGLLHLDGIELNNNDADSGAALHITQGSMVQIDNSHIHHNNVLTKGGAIFCDSASLTISQNNLINDNTASGTAFGTGIGGAIFAENCQMNIRAGHQDGQSAGFINNQSSDDGGAIAAENSNMTFDGQYAFETQHPIVFKGNISDVDDNGNGTGGAIYMHRGVAFLQSIWMDGNLGSPSGTGQFNRGAALHASRGAEVVLTQDPTIDCWRSKPCNLIENSNHVVLYIQRPDTSFAMTDTEVRHNDAPYTGIIWVRNSCCIDNGDGPFVTLENNVFHHNTSANSGLIKTDASTNDCCQISINMQHNTITDNVGNGGLVDINQNVTLNFNNNIIHNVDKDTWAFDIFDDPSTTASIDCILVEDGSLVPNHATGVLVGDPLFFDSTNENYHLTAASPAIDACEPAINALSPLDIDTENRGNDLPSVNNLSGSHDIGADEFYLPDLIFKQGFEG